MRINRLIRIFVEVCEQMHKNLKRKIKPKEQFPAPVSLDKAVYCYYADFNARFEDRTQHGFAKCHDELVEMFDRVYGDTETDDPGGCRTDLTALPDDGISLEATG